MQKLLLVIAGFIAGVIFIFTLPLLFGHNEDLLIEWLKQNKTALDKIHTRLDKMEKNIETMLMPQPEEWPLSLWRRCWDRENCLVDFTVDEWKKLSIQEQARYSRAYQEWYAWKYRLPVEKKLDRCGTSFNMVLIVPGRFWMGSPSQEIGRDPDEKQWCVTISRPFYLGKSEVTQQQWQAVIKSDPSNFKGETELPVEQVSWQECDNFCKKIELKLPTEAQWEYACRAGTTTPFNLGQNITPTQVNYDGNCPYAQAAKGENRNKTVGVASLPNANPWGIYDCHGNVWEWCTDWYGNYPSGVQTDPIGPENGTKRIVRGGSWYRDAGNCRCANRWQFDSTETQSSIGLRVMLVLENDNH